MDNIRITLRELRPADVSDDYLQWFRDSVVTEFLDARGITREQAIEYMEEGRRSRTHFMYAIIDADNDLHIGNLKIGPVQWQHRIADLVVLIGRREYWGKGLATEAIRQGNQVAFEQYDLRKVSGGIAEGNIGSVKAYTRAGWVIEGRLKGHHLIEGEARDRIMVSCFNPKYFPELSSKAT